MRSTQPNLSVRYHAGMSDDFLKACMAVIRCGFGMPAFNNDEIVIPEFIKLGGSEDAYNYSAIGCMKPQYREMGLSLYQDEFVNFARVMLAALEQGKDAQRGKTFPATRASV